MPRGENPHSIQTETIPQQRTILKKMRFDEEKIIFGESTAQVTLVTPRYILPQLSKKSTRFDSNIMFKNIKLREFFRKLLLYSQL